MYSSLSNTCERDGITSARATSLRIRRKAAITGFGIHNIHHTHHKPLVCSESVDSIPVGSKICAEFDHPAAFRRDASS